MRILRKKHTGIKSLKLCSCFIAIILTWLVSGCSWFDGNSNKDNHEEVEQAQIVTTAPSAVFLISAVSGQAPFSVTFTDNSQNGSANITEWQWDFGDGGTSSVQNPEHIYEVSGTYDISLTVNSADGSDSTTMLAAITIAPADTQIIVTIVDSRGVALEGVTATSETFTIASQSYNELKQLSITVRPSASQGVFRLSKEGYTDNLIYAGHTNFSNTVPATLLKRTPAIEFNGFLGGEIIGIDGTSVTIPAESLIKPDGSIVTGTVELYMTPVDISDPIKSKAFPGSFYGLPDEDQIPTGYDPQQQLFSYGVVEYAFFADGEELQLREGIQAELQLPLYTTKNIFDEDLVIGGIIPLWILNETTGIWEQQGEGSIIANPVAGSGFSLKASTSHFTWFNTDSWSLSSTGSVIPQGGGGSSVNFENRGSCIMSITLVGAEIGEYLRFGLNNFFGRPMSNLSQYFEYDGTPIMTNIPQGTNIEASADQGRNSASKLIRCFEETGEAELILMESAPEFIDWNLQAEPVFSRSSDSDLYEILENEVLIGGHFVGDESVEVETTLLGAEILSLPDSQLFSAPFKPSDTSPTQITATLSNESGTVEKISSVDYVASHSPVLEYFYVQPTDFSLEYFWKVKGADRASIYYLGEDANNTNGDFYFNIEDMEKGFFLNDQLLGKTGFLRIEIENQYGVTVKIARLAELICFSGSEHPNCLL
jgi:PKD repeat protein